MVNWLISELLNLGPLLSGRGRFNLRFTIDSAKRTADLRDLRLRDDHIIDSVKQRRICTALQY